jgi:capsular polysaccharide transport system permease protein
MKQDLVQSEDLRPSSGAADADAVVAPVGARRRDVRSIFTSALVRFIPGRLSATGIRPEFRPRFNWYLTSFYVFVIVPAIVAVLYLTFVASDQYIAETRFAVRSLQSDGGTDKASTSLLGSSAVPVMADQDAYIVVGYIHSRAIVDDLSSTIDLRSIFRRPEADFWARLKADASIEDLVKYWDVMVETYVDRPSGIVTVAVKAFRPDDALLLSRAVLMASEKLVNDVSARARADAMRAAEDEVRRYEAQVRDALLALRSFRDREGFISPTTEATSTSTLLMQVMSEKIKLQNDLFVASRAMSPNAPTVQTMRSRLENVDRQIDQLKAQLASHSTDGRPLSKSLVKFEELELQRTFAEKLYSMAQDALERARMRAERQNLYISEFVQPSLPQQPTYPQRFALSFIIPIALLVVWGILALIGAAVEDHRI